MTTKTFGQTFADLLGVKFPEYTFTVMKGSKFDRIVQESVNHGQRHVHAFVERSTGHVFKAAGWKAPAKDARYLTVTEAVEAADPFGSYLYK